MSWSLSLLFQGLLPRKRRRSEPFPSSDLYDLVVLSRWNRALIVLRECPLDAQYFDENLETPLYVACQNSPSSHVVRALIEAYPAAVSQKSRHGDLPLHIACRYNSSIDVIRELVAADPQTTSQPSKWGITPVRTLWDSRERTTSIAQEVDNYNTVLWQKVGVLLEAVAVARGSPSHWVHAAVFAGCPIEIVNYAIHLNPDQVRERDRSGRLPLHIAVGENHQTIQTSSRGRRFAPQQHHIIPLLLDLYPAAAGLLDPNEDARYPLHTALTEGHTWRPSIQAIFRASPDVAHVADPRTGLFPYQYTATIDDLESSFGLLREQPHVLGLRTRPAPSELDNRARAVARKRSRWSKLGIFWCALTVGALSFYMAVCVRPEEVLSPLSWPQALF